MAQGTGAFELPFNHRNWKPDGSTYRHSVTTTQWQNARNDLPPGPCPNDPPPWIRAMHLSLIPPSAPALAGRVLVFDGDENEDPDGTQFWSIVDPTLPDSDDDKFWNFELSGIRSGDPNDPTGGRLSDFGCAGHCWMVNGKLFVAAGTSKVVGGVSGTWFAYVFDPAAAPGNAMWQRTTEDMVLERWYPSGTLFWHHAEGERILVPGGRDKNVTPTDYDNYEAFEPSAIAPPGQWKAWGPTGTENRLFQGPEGIGQHYLHFYPRLHQLSNGDLFRSGMPQHGSVVHHVDGPGTVNAQWSPRGITTPLIHRDYGASILFPNIDPLHVDALVVLGGQDPVLTGPVLDSVQICKGTATEPGGFYDQGRDWTSLPSMISPRVYLNVVILPDASLIAFGGKDAQGLAVTNAERFAGGDAWLLDAPHRTIRDYHSTAVLLPDGRVLVAGGDSRCWDYTLYQPPYLTGGKPRPAFVPSPPTLTAAAYDTRFTVEYSGLPAGTTIEKVVLMRPGSTTHHSDFDQRYVELDFEIVLPVPPQTGTFVRFTTPIAPPGLSNPANSNAAPPGWYMLFLVSSDGVPSVAGWIELQ